MSLDVIYTRPIFLRKSMKINPLDIDLVIYHKNCYDGFGSAWAAWKLLGSSAIYHAAAHGDQPPDVRGKSVAILDFSYPRKIIKEMMKDAKDLIVIDHHKSAMADLNGLPCSHFDMNHSGAVLAWNFFHPEKESPRFIKYIEDRDLWSWSLPRSRAFSAGLGTRPLTFDSFSELEEDSVFDTVCKSGAIILRYMNAEVDKISRRATSRTWRGKKIFIVNSSQLVSEVGNKLSSGCDFAVIWHFDHDKQKYKVSLRSSQQGADVSSIARFFGGGGHKNAAGFGVDRKSFDDTHIDDIFSPDLELYQIREKE